MNTLQTIFLIATATPPPATGPWQGLTPELTIASPQSVIRRVEGGRTPFVSETSATRTKRLAAEFAPVSDRIEALSSLRRFALWGANWDGDGAPAPRRKDIESASVLLGLLDDLVVRTPSVMLNAHGEPMLLLDVGSSEMSVTVQSARTVRFLVTGQGVEEGGLARFSGDAIPSKLKRALEAAHLTFA